MNASMWYPDQKNKMKNENMASVQQIVWLKEKGKNWEESWISKKIGFMIKTTLMDSYEHYYYTFKKIKKKIQLAGIVYW